MHDQGGFGFLWPDIDDAASARAASRLGVLGAVLTALWTVVVVTAALLREDPSDPPTSVFAYADAVLFAFLAWGVWRLWRVAAIAALALFLLEQILAATRTGSIVSLILPIFLTLLFISGVRGVFAFRKFARGASQISQRSI